LGDAAGTALMGVLSGTVRIGVHSAAGREAVFNLVHAGEIFGEIALLDGYLRTADADCELNGFDRRAMNRGSRSSSSNCCARGSADRRAP
jgi:CRP/FNR family transcriptional regulator, cyclic AMP receptor protein